MKRVQRDQQDLVGVQPVYAGETEGQAAGPQDSGPGGSILGPALQWGAQVVQSVPHYDQWCWWGIAFKHHDDKSCQSQFTSGNLINY